MNMAKHQRWLAGALCAALTACSSIEHHSASASNSSDADGSANKLAGTASSASGAMHSASTTGSNVQTSHPGASSSLASGSSSSSSSQSAYGTVQSVDALQRQDVGMGALGASAVGGSMGAPTDRVYRVAVRMDDGTMQMVVVDNKPSYKTGDRVRYNNGTLEQY